MENRDKDKMRNTSIPQDKSKSDMSTDFSKNIGKSEEKLNEPISRQSGSVGSSGMESGSKVGGSSDLNKSSDLGSKDKNWGDKGSQGSKQ
ncbi:MAG TPA: hypothetical protein VG323_02000 [Thermoanaerobaculia bacterium]|nr:hypothetical protein [Thermoanaerobaculia bacterium]